MGATRGKVMAEENKLVEAQVNVLFASDQEPYEEQWVQVNMKWNFFNDACFDYLSMSTDLQGNYTVTIYVFKLNTEGTPVYERVQNSTAIHAPTSLSGRRLKKVKTININFT